MKEELYVYTSSGERKELKLGAESGITLKWVSNIFNSLNKVNCSYSYTFKVPITRQNAEALDLADDMRYSSGMVRRKVKADFIQNGVPLFTNANLYVNQVNNGNYQCVFTFNVLDGLQKLNDDDCDLNELRTMLTNAGYTEFAEKFCITWWENEGDTTNGDYSALKYGRMDEACNTIPVIHPLYYAGNTWVTSPYFRPRYAPLPVMPVRYILQCINKAFGINIQLGKDIGLSFDPMNTDKSYFSLTNVFKGENIVTYGVIPFVKAEMTEAQIKLFCYSLGQPTGYYYDYQKCGKCGVLVWSGVSSFGNLYSDYVKPCYFNFSVNFTLPSNEDMVNEVYISKTKKTGFALAGFYSKFECELDGAFVVRTDKAITYNTEEGKLNEDTLLKLKVYKIQLQETYKDWDSDGYSTTWEVIDEQTISHDGGNDYPDVYATNHFDDNGEFDYAEYYFNFHKEDGRDRITVGAEGKSHVRDKYEEHAYFFGFSEGFAIKDVVWKEPLKIYPNLNDAKKLPHKMDTFSNLPDIGCLEFVKSIYYLMGAFPKVMSDGSIGAVPYAQLESNVKSGNVYDWSKKVIGTVDERPDEMTYKAGDFVQNNYFLSKWDDLDRTEDELEDEEFVYQDGIFNIQSNNKSLNDEQTVHTSPYYPPFTLNRNTPDMQTGDSVKLWEYDYPDVVYGKTNPVYGIINTEEHHVKALRWDRVNFKYYTQRLPVGPARVYGNADTFTIFMDVLNPFNSHNFSQFLYTKNPNWEYMQKIVQDPVTVTEKLLLNEFDLRDIDFAKPVYLEKYNSYFAIVTIQRDSKGVCKCELLKIPNE